MSTVEARNPGNAVSFQWSMVYAASTVSSIEPELGSVTSKDWWPGAWPGVCHMRMVPSP